MTRKLKFQRKPQSWLPPATPVYDIMEMLVDPEAKKQRHPLCAHQHHTPVHFKDDNRLDLCIGDHV